MGDMATMLPTIIIRLPLGLLLRSIMLLLILMMIIRLPLGLLLRNIMLLPILHLTSLLFLRDGLLTLTRTLSDGLTSTQTQEQLSGRFLFSTPLSTPPLTNLLFPQGGLLTLTTDTRDGSTSIVKSE
jgi:hypothetical protein